ncbi:hypothetical protein ABH935_009328 [Catenulispora sp. GAS73]|uniref:transposase family protein n=1 Tax=Catenulispora sp. GAS73 TaxID=3156269 RepID=UPI003511C52B
MLIDGTLVRTRRRTGVQHRKNYSGRHKVHGLLFLAITDGKGNLGWISAAKAGGSPNITVARHNDITAKLREASLGAIGDLGFVGLGVRRERAANEHGFANLKAWRILAKVRMNAKHATALLRALPVLIRLQVTR